MSVRSASDLTVIELKEKLKELGLSCTGNKNELIVRLNESDPSGTWTEKLPEIQETEDAEGATSLITSGRTTPLIEAQLEEHSRDKRMLEAELDALRREVESLRV